MKDETYTLARFWSKVEVKHRSRCWLWKAKTSSFGYGMFSIGRGKFTHAHRFAWQVEHGLIPDGLQVLHQCDTPACVNPSHLFLGTQADNVADMIAKGRLVVGAHHGTHNAHAVLTPSQVIEIRRRYAAGEKQRDIAKDYPVQRSQIGNIVRRQTWKFV